MRNKETREYRYILGKSPVWTPGALIRDIIRDYGIYPEWVSEDDDKDFSVVKQIKTRKHGVQN